ncbi:hypothetical protein VPH35_121066 [Triticum aestivum]|uniref:Uncharacterized protein n=1 Tax=Triticum turgidum subsp. durum TaxID=4567 RepID=A0A9R0Z2F9_TRITD|nr:unnamed protein product [Triticum turgidum subsp. durum]
MDYLLWVLCPSSIDECHMLANNMVEVSHSWARNNNGHPSYAYHTSTVNHRRKSRMPTLRIRRNFMFQQTVPIPLLQHYANTGLVLASMMIFHPVVTLGDLVLLFPYLRNTCVPFLLHILLICFAFSVCMW